MGNLGFQELFVIFLIALVLIGPKRLPDLARALGEAVRAFQDTLRGGPGAGGTRDDDDAPEPRRVPLKESKP